MPKEDDKGDENLEENTRRNEEKENEVVNEVGLIVAVDVSTSCRNRFDRSLLAILDRSSPPPAVFSVSKNFENGIDWGFDSEHASSFTRKQPRGPGP